MKSRNKNNDKSLQDLLNEQMKAQQEMQQIDQAICHLQNQVLGKNWWDGNFMINWSRYPNEEKQKQITLFPNVRVFSLSNVASSVSRDLTNIEGHTLDHNEIHNKNQARKKFKSKPRKEKGKKGKKNSTFQDEKQSTSKTKPKKVRKIKRKPLKTLKIHPSKKKYSSEDR